MPLTLLNDDGRPSKILGLFVQSGWSADMPRRSPRQSDTVVPVFFLFGEPQRSVNPTFLHLETLEERSRPSEWNIRPHTHTDLHHLFLIAYGAGTMTADAVTHVFTAPCLLIVPANAVHAFAWQRETRGQVLTLADGALRDLLSREPGFARLFSAPACLPGADAEALNMHLAALGGELAWSAPGHATAVQARLQLVLVEALRLHEKAGTQHAPSPRRAVRLVARFREAVEARYRSNAPVEAYAANLGVTTATLRRACLQAAGTTPLRILHARVFLEAQRLLLFTNMSVAETAATLGFEDCAYFTRFFTKLAAVSPRSYRVAAAQKERKEGLLS
jgi:AraC family transcriptional activator of pobA